MVTCNVLFLFCSARPKHISSSCSKGSWQGENDQRGTRHWFWSPEALLDINQLLLTKRNSSLWKFSSKLFTLYMSNKKQRIQFILKVIWGISPWDCQHLEFLLKKKNLWARRTVGINLYTWGRMAWRCTENKPSVWQWNWGTLMIVKEMTWICSLFQTFAPNIQTCWSSLYSHMILRFAFPEWKCSFWFRERKPWMLGVYCSNCL